MLTLFRRTFSLQRYQAACAAVETSETTDWMEVTAEMQTKLIEGHLVAHAADLMADAVFREQSIEVGLHMLRNAANIFPGNPLLETIPLYRRHNRAKKGNMSVGDKAVDVVLARGSSGSDAAEFEFTSLLAQAAPDRPLVVMAGSIS